MVLRPLHTRSIALAACALFLGSGLLARHHQASADHGYCSEHGEPIHLEGFGSGARRRPSAPSAILPVPPVRGQHGCLALHLLATPFVGGASSASSVLARPLPAPGAAADQLAHAAISILRAAPKISPPA